MYFEKESNRDNNLSPVKSSALGERIAEGSHTKVYAVEGAHNFVVKIGETKGYSPPILKALKLSLPRKAVSKFLENMLGPEFKITPDVDFIRNGVAEYLLMKKYFGSPEGGAGENERRERETLFSDLDDGTSDFHKELLKIIETSKALEQIKGILLKHQKDNFLPEEQVVIGHPPDLSRQRAGDLQCAGKKLPVTYYLFQKQITGTDVVPLQYLSDYDLKTHRDILERLMTFAILTKKMYFDTGKLIDMRPDEIGKHPLEWFRKTSNLVVDKGTDQIWFVDTRWLWDKKSIMGKKWFNLIDWLGTRSVDRAITIWQHYIPYSKTRR